MFKERGSEISLILIFLAVMAALQLFTRKEPEKQPNNPAVNVEVMNSMPAESTLEEVDDSAGGPVHLKDVIAARADAPVNGADLTEEVLVSGLVVQLGEEALVYIGELDILAEADIGLFLEAQPNETAHIVAVTFDSDPPQWQVGQEVSFTAFITMLATDDGEAMKVRYLGEETE